MPEFNHRKTIYGYSMNVIIVSFYMSNINPEVVRHQKMVMDKLYPNSNFLQISTQYRHGQSMDLFLFQRKEDIVVFLDIDAIPLTTSSIPKIIEMTENGSKIAGSPQRSNHIENNEHIFIAPSTLAINPQLYRDLGCPSALETSRGDVAEEWTYALEERGGSIAELDLMGFETEPHGERWYLRGDQIYGLNTTFGINGQELFFHAFQGRMASQQQSFINKCKSIL